MCAVAGSNRSCEAEAKEHGAHVGRGEPGVGERAAGGGHGQVGALLVGAGHAPLPHARHGLERARTGAEPRAGLGDAPLHLGAREHRRREGGGDGGDAHGGGAHG
jgi:hypothetical protein